MKKAKITYIPIDGTGALHLDFLPGPFGDAVEANHGDGIGFFTSNGVLQGVTFDEVSESRDHQVLEFDLYRIEITVNKGKTAYSVAQSKAARRPSRTTRKKTQSAA